MITERKGDLFKEIDKHDVLVHGCNCFCTFGKGFALHVKRLYPEAFEADLRTQKGDRRKLGTLTQAITPKLTVVNAYTQYYYGKGGPHFDLSAFRSCMQMVKSLHSGKRIVMPRVGSGLAGGDWLKTREVLEEVLGDEVVSVVNID